MTFDNCNNENLSDCFENFKIVIDRIEGEYAVCELPDSSVKDIKLSLIPRPVKARDSLLVKFSDSNELEIISVIPFESKGKRRIPPRFMRFN